MHKIFLSSPEQGGGSLEYVGTLICIVGMFFFEGFLVLLNQVAWNL